MLLVQQSSIPRRPYVSQLAPTIYQYPFTQVKICFFFVSVYISTTRVKNSRKANRRGILVQETYIFCLLRSPSSHKTGIITVQRLSSFMEAEASFSPCLCCVRFESSAVNNSINSNEIFCFLPAICCLWEALKITVWLKWLQMEILLYNTDFLSHIEHLRWVWKTSKNSYLLWMFHHPFSYCQRRIGILTSKGGTAVPPQISLYVLNLSLIRLLTSSIHSISIHFFSLPDSETSISTA